MFYVLFALIFLLSPAYAENETIRIYEFYAQGCIHCGAVDRYLVNIEREYPQVEIFRLELSHNYDNLLLGRRFCDAYEMDCGESMPTPTLFINDTYILGDRPTFERLQPIIDECIVHGCIDPIDNVEGVDVSDVDLLPPLLVVIIAALIDSINPCAFAVLIFMLQYLSGVGDSRRMIKMGSVYIGVVYITYMLAGLGLLTAFQSLQMTSLVYSIAAVIAIAAGLVNIKDYFFYGKWISLSIPKSQSERIKKYIQKGTLPAAVILGVIVSAVELPCTGGAYLAVLAMLQWAPLYLALGYLIIYNLFFVLPLVVLLLLFVKGYSAESLEKMRIEKRKYMRLAIGLMLLLLGVGMLMGWFTAGYWGI